MSGIEFEGVKKDPYKPSEIRKTRQMVESYMKGGQTLKDRLRPDQIEAKVKIKNPNSVARIMLISDLHFGSEASGIESIKEIMRELDKPDTYAILAGDLLEGVKQEYMSTTTGALLNFQEQIDVFRGLYLRKKIEEKKVLAVVSRYGSHDDWPSGKESLNGPAIMLDSLTLPDGSRIPLIMNDGRLFVKIGDSPEVGIQLYHKVGGSGSTLNPVKPHRGVILNKKIDRDQKVPMVVLAGHNHSRAGVSSERVLAGNTEVQLVLLQGGTVKGLNYENPDFFMVEKGGVLIQPPGAAMVIRHKKEDNQIQTVPAYGNERSGRLQEAFEVLNRSESLGVTEELRQELENEDGELQLILNEENSLVAERSGGQEIESKLYRQLTWRVDVGKLGLPTCVHLISHVDFGSGQADLNQVDKIINETNKSQRSGLLVLNGMLDTKVPRRDDRIDVLDDFAETIGKVPLSKQMGVMLDSVLRDDAWNKEIGKMPKCDIIDLLDEEDGDMLEDDEKKLLDGGAWEGRPIITGDYLYYESKLKGTPLYEGGATVTFDIGHNRFNFLIVDGVGNYGSRKDPYLGLIQMDNQSNVRNDVVTGGNSTIPGALTTPETIFVANGWNALVKDRRYGKSSMIRVPKGGQGVIMFPNGGGKGLIYGAGSLRELNDSFRALSLHQGLLARGEYKEFMRKRRK